MFGNAFFTSRNHKETLLKEIIQKLSISEWEKDLYTLSIEVLDNTDFDSFYQKITSQFQINKQYNTSIEPLSATLI